MTIRVDTPADLDPAAVLRVAEGESVSLSDALLERLAASRAETLAALASAGPVYGVNTGMGSQAHLAIGTDEQPAFQGDLMVARVGRRTALDGPPHPPRDGRRPAAHPPRARGRRLPRAGPGPGGAARRRRARRRPRVGLRRGRRDHPAGAPRRVPLRASARGSRRPAPSHLRASCCETPAWRRTRSRRRRAWPSCRAARPPLRGPSCSPTRRGCSWLSSSRSPRRRSRSCGRRVIPTKRPGPWRQGSRRAAGGAARPGR